MRDTCAACGGPPTQDAEEAYQHTPDCRIGKRLAVVRQLAAIREMIDQPPLGTPGVKAMAKIGRLTMKGRSREQILAVLTPEEREAATAEARLHDLSFEDLFEHEGKDA